MNLIKVPKIIEEGFHVNKNVEHEIDVWFKYMGS